MSALVARCPHCDTAFRVVPEQLRVRQGRVRCGVCHQVFDGNAALLKAGLAPVVLRTSDPVAAAPVVAPVAPPGLPQAGPGRAEPVLGSADLPSGSRQGREPVFAAGSPGVPASPSARGAEPSLGGGRSVWRDPVSAGHTQFVPPLVSEPFAARSGSSVRQGRPGSEPHLGSAESDARHRSAVVFDPVVDRPEFVASRPDAPLPPMLAGQAAGGLTRLLFSLGFWLALLALVVQALWWWRTPLATHIPVLRTPFQAVCQSFGCQVGYVRAPQRLSIVASSVQPAVLGGSADVQHLQLQAVLRNRAPHPQPWPALEITLTDHADAVVAKRVVPPEAYLPAGLSREPFGAGADRDIHLALAARGAPISGYRLNLFFP